MPPAAQPTGSELDAWTAFSQAARMLVTRLDSELQRETGLPLNCFEILSVLAQSPDGIRMSELAALTHSSPSRITHTVDRLAERGWVERRNCEADRRGCTAVITVAGAAAFEEANSAHTAIVRAHLVDGLSASQLLELCAISKTVLDHLCTRSARPA